MSDPLARELPDCVFVTGMQRSGTTLVDRLLDDAGAGISVLSQPFPLLFPEAKRAFLTAASLESDGYPLGNLFLEDRYGPADLQAFLDRWVPNEDALRGLFAAMDGYSGQYTRFTPAEVDAALEGLEAESFPALIRSLYRRLGRDPAARSAGGKEVVCEEFIPSFLAEGFEVVLVVRDPRDVLASLNHGRGREHAGRLKPTVFNVRNWRKSAAFALGLEGSPRFRVLRYEDVVRSPEMVTAPYGGGPVGATSTTSPRWAGNSSFGPRSGVDARSVGVFRRELPPDVARFVEASCLPELRALGYEAELSVDQARSVVAEFVDPYPLERPELASYLELERSREELRRFDLLANGNESRATFILPATQRRLASTFID